MFNTKLLSKKITILLLAGSIVAGQSCNISANFFYDTLSSAKNIFLDATGLNNAKKYAKIGACSLSGLAGYKLLAKPLACNLFGRPAKFLTKFIDKGLKYSFYAALIGGAFYFYHKYNQNKLLNAIKKTREDVLEELDKTENRLAVKIDTGFKNTSEKIENVKKDTKSIDNKLEKVDKNIIDMKTDINKILAKVDPQAAPIDQKISNL